MLAAVLNELWLFGGLGLIGAVVGILWARVAESRSLAREAISRLDAERASREVAAEVRDTFAAVSEDGAAGDFGSSW